MSDRDRDDVAASKDRQSSDLPTAKGRGASEDVPTAKGPRPSDVATVDARPGAAPKIADEPQTRTGDLGHGSAFERPVDRFETLGELGRGGMGRVDDAIDRTLGRPVAIKHMLSHSDVDLARFEREVRITARLEHPGIVPIHEAGRGADGTPYYVMRRVDGQPLSEVVADKSLVERLALVPNLLAACDAAGFAHARGIVHRDIKPTNILIGPFGETLLIDWGLARELGEHETGGAAIEPSDQNLTRAGTIAGTPGFMAPEQARGETVDARADVFALGATLFYVLSGQLPWAASQSTELVNLAGAGRPPDWRLLPREVPPDLRAVLEKAMAGELAQRYADAGALAADLRRFITGNLVGAYQYGRVARLVRWMRRHRAAVAVASISVLVLSIVGVISIRRVLAERDDATAARALAESRQREAAAMADRLLVQRAQELATTDSAASIALLRRLPVESTRWRDAWTAASTAAAQGIPFGFNGDSEARHVQVAGDRHAFVVTSNTGRLVVYDLIARTQRQVATLGRTFSSAWLVPGRFIACKREGDLAIVDVTTGNVRTLPLELSTLFGDRASRVWMQTADGRLLELSDPTGVPRELATGVTNVYASVDLSEAVVVRGVQRELWSGGRVWRLPDATSESMSMAVGGQVVASMEGREVRMWRLHDHQIVDAGRFPPALYQGVIVVRGRVFVFATEGVLSLTEKGEPYLAHRGQYTGFTVTPAGFVLSTPAGEVKVYDLEGWFKVGQQPSAFSRLDASPDGRFVVALATGGDTLAWDLARVKPRRIRIGPTRELLAVTPTSLWFIQLGFGLHRYDLASGSSELVIPDVSLLEQFGVDHRGRWVTAFNVAAGKLRVYAPTLGVRVFGGIAAVAYDDDTMELVHVDGAISRWRLALPSLQPRGKLPVIPSALASNGEYLLALVGDREVMRWSSTTQRIDRATLPAPVGRFSIEDTGRSWLIVDGSAWRWELDAAAPKRFETAEQVHDIRFENPRVILQGNRALFVVNGDEQSLIPVVSRSSSWLDSELVAIVSPKHEVSVLDVRTGLAVKLPSSATAIGRVFATSSSVVYPTSSDTVSMFELTVPRDPAQLRRWLTDVTNAKPVPNSEVVAWP